MNNSYGSKWVRQILALQKEDGSWGYFHTLSQPSKKQPMTTEQALRRLYILGLTKNDEPIQCGLRYMENCLIGNSTLPDRREKLHDWDIFTDLMLSAWLRIFEPENEAGLHIARRWAGIIEKAFETGMYDHGRYAEAYAAEFGLRPAGGRLVDFVSFYQVSLLRGVLPIETEERMLDYIISHSAGIYYIYSRPLNILPEVFESREASRYISALELLSGYARAGGKLRFATEWLRHHQDENGQWDLGMSAKDGIYLPISDSWRNPEDRKNDCTSRIKRLLNRLEEYNIIHIVGASGAGTSTLGQALEREYGYKWLDTDDYYWLPTDPPFMQARPCEERIALLSADIQKYPKCVISGSLGIWGDSFIPDFDLVIFIDTATDIRVDRLQRREYERFGNRIREGGDMYDEHIGFIEWAKNYDTMEPPERCRALHEAWFKLLTCPLLRLDGSAPVEKLLERIQAGR